MENASPPPATVKVWKNEEKGSDVNIAVHVLNDAWQNAHDCAVVVSNDSDLAEAHNSQACELVNLARKEA